MPVIKYMKLEVHLDHIKFYLPKMICYQLRKNKMGSSFSCCL